MEITSCNRTRPTASGTGCRPMLTLDDIHHLANTAGVTIPADIKTAS